MISVLIPVYNYNVTNLVTKLISQLNQINKPYEIIIVEDGSKEYLNQNKLLRNIKNVKLYQFLDNRGRSKTRNFLAEKAKYNWLLFLDADVLPVSDIFIKSYVLKLNENIDTVVISGGLKYEKDRPSNAKNLRWMYGVKREELSQEKRQKRSNKITLGANFLIHKSLFKKCKFNEKLVKYGYEDVLFLQDLIKLGYTILHINNPVYHLGLDSNERYLTKTKESIQNLNYLINEIKFNGNQFRIIRIYELLKSINFDKIIASFYRKFSNQIENLLTHKITNIYLLDFYKLSYLCHLTNKNTK